MPIVCAAHGAIGVNGFRPEPHCVRARIVSLFRRCAIWYPISCIADIPPGTSRNPRANFIIHAGDLVNKDERDTEWAEWYAAKGFITGMIPIIPVAGNHEYLSTKEGGSKDGKAVLTDLWRPQFTLPIENALPAPLHETVFDLRYGDNVHVFVLDSSSPLWQQQMDWLRTKATTSTADWKIVALHHSPFRPGIQGYANNHSAATGTVAASKHF